MRHICVSVALMAFLGNKKKVIFVMLNVKMAQ